MKPLRKDEIKLLNAKLSELYRIGSLSKKDAVMIKGDIIWVNGSADFFYLDALHEKLIPTLRFLLKHDALPKLVVDMGAVKFMAKGADVMRPGVVSIADGIKKDDAVVVVDEKNQKPLAVALALFSSEEMRIMEGGKVAKNLHYVGDAVWNAS